MVSAIGMYTSPSPCGIPVRVVNTTPAGSRPKSSSTPKPCPPVEPLAVARAPAPMVTYPLGSGVGRSTPLVTIAPTADCSNSASRFGVRASAKSAHSVAGSEMIRTRPVRGVAAPAPTAATSTVRTDDDGSESRRREPSGHTLTGSGSGWVLGP